MNDGGAFLARIEISLDCQRIFRGNIRIRSKAAVQEMPLVIAGTAVQSGQCIVIEVLCEYAVARISTERSAILHSPERLPFRASSGRDQTALRVCGGLGDN